MADTPDLTQQLLDSEERYRALALATFEGILIHRDGVVVEANDELARMIGHPREHLLGGRIADFLSPGAGATVTYHLANPAGDKHYEVWGERPDGQRYYAEVRSRDIAYQGRPARVAVVREITDQKRVEENLRASELEMRAILANMQDTFYRTDRTGLVILASPSCHDLLHYTADELIGTPLSDLYVFPEDRQRFLELLAHSGGRIRQYRTLLRRKDGHHIWVSTNAQYYYDAAGNYAGVEGTTRDISHMIESEEKLQQALRAAEAANRAKGDFLAVMRHEIRTPLNGVLTTAQLLAGTPLDTEQRAFIDTIASSGRLLSTLLNDILDLSRIEAGKLQIKHEDFELTRAFRSLRAAVEPLATAKGLAFRMRQQGMERAVFVRGDEARLQQILLNLLNNAVKFTEQGFVELVVDVRPGLRDCLISMRVSDSGIGIPAARQQRLFRPFEQGDTSITRRFGGTGLGLAITRELVHAMGGRITVQSEERHGATFEVVLTLESASGNTAAAGDDRPEDRYEFLLVDDDAINRTAMSALLRRDGHRVTLAHDGFEALDILARDRFDCVLIDVHMPGIDGIETVRRYRSEGGERAAQAQIIALTADTGGEIVRRCGEVGICHTLQKPLVKQELYRAISARDGLRHSI